MTTADSEAVPDYADLLRLDGKGFVVLGAGVGMGRQTSHALTQMGARVFCVDLDEQRAKEIAGEVDGIPWAADVTQRSEMDALAAAAEEELGRIDGLVDIVGMAGWAGIFDIDDEAWDREMAANLRHAYLASQVVGRRMGDSGGGTMVFIASASALSAAPMHAAYGAAKAGLIAWMQSVAIEMGPLGIRANAVSPGVILTPRMREAFTPEKAAENTAVVPVGRMGTPADIAGAVLYLSSPLSSFVSGRMLLVDGGVDAKFPYTPL